jgi:hypothetical protein
MEDDQNILHRHHHHKGPNNDGKDANEVVVRRFGGEGRGVDIERTGSDVTIDDTNALVCEPHQDSSFEDLTQ